MFYLVCSVYFRSKLLLKKPVQVDEADSLGTVFDSLQIEGTSSKRYYLLPSDYTRVENSGLSISPNGISQWVSSCVDDTADMCRQLSMKHVRFRVGQKTVEKPLLDIFVFSFLCSYVHVPHACSECILPFWCVNVYIVSFKAMSCMLPLVFCSGSVYVSVCSI